MLNLRNDLYQKLSENTSQFTKSHANFLQFRQESLLQISLIIQHQLDCLQHILDKDDIDNEHSLREQ